MTFSSFSAVLAEMRSIYPGIAQYCGKSHVNVDSDDRVRAVIDKFFSNPSITDRIDHKTLDRFVPKLLHSDPKIQRQFVNTYILETSTGGVDRFTEHTKSSGKILKEGLVSNKVHEFHGVTKDTVNSGYFSHSNYLSKMYSDMIHDPRVKEDFLYFLSFNGADDLKERIEYTKALRVDGKIEDNEYKDEIDRLLMRRDEITNAYLQRNFPETLTGEKYPLTIDKIAERVNPEADFNDGQIVLDILIGHITKDHPAINVTGELKTAYKGKITVNGNAITLQPKLSKNDVNEFLEKFIEENRVSLSDLTRFDFMYNHEIKTLPRAVKRLEISFLVVDGCPRFKLPEWIGDLALRNLTVCYGLLSRLPLSIPKLRMLEVLHLHHNRLRGPIPPDLAALTNLRSLDLSRNKLSGPIPFGLGALTTLSALNLSNNQLIGPIPSELGHLTTLRSLYLSNSQLSGSIPPQLGALTNLIDLNLSNNQLVGPIPPNIQGLIDRRVADLRGNPDL